jgi:hypothetical protein
MTERVIELPIRNPQLFSPEINREVLSHGKLHFILSSAIQALPYVAQPECRENLKQALCEILLWDRAS